MYICINDRIRITGLHCVIAIYLRRLLAVPHNRILLLRKKKGLLMVGEREKGAINYAEVSCYRLEHKRVIRGEEVIGGERRYVLLGRREFVQDSI